FSSESEFKEEFLMFISRSGNEKLFNEVVVPKDSTYLEKLNILLKHKYLSQKEYDSLTGNK
ncbi:MAG: hypothetical protein KJ949_01445, partial [Nanoarchaeota archaeon]|nr:hypothetical protein [Nanoarchaeota archaeon]